MSSTTRRSFLKTGLAAGAIATVGTLPLGAAKRTATDTVVLGRSKLEVTRLAFGTGTDSGAVQAALGQQGVHAACALRVRPRHPLFRDG